MPGHHEPGAQTRVRREAGPPCRALLEPRLEAPPPTCHLSSPTAGGGPRAAGQGEDTSLDCKESVFFFPSAKGIVSVRA